MEDIKNDLKKRIYELEEGVRSLEEMGSVGEPGPIDITLVISACTNMIKAKGLLEFYNKHFYDEDLIESEKELDRELKLTEPLLIEVFKEYLSL